MSSESLEEAIQRVGSPVEALRNASTRPYTFPVVPEFTNWRCEQTAWRASCALFDQSHHMTDLYLRGPDALTVLRDFGVNTFAHFCPGTAKQYVAVNRDGYVIGDAVLYYLTADLFNLVGHPTVLNWLQYNAEQGDYHVTTERDENSANRTAGPPRQYRYQLQGPAAEAILEKLTEAPVPPVRWFTLTEFRIDGHRVQALRHGMAGQPGFELFGPWAEAEAVHAAMLQAGAEFGLVQVGAKAYSTANLESGWIPTVVPAIFGPEMESYRQWLGADALGSLAGSMHAGDITDYYVTPEEIGYGHLVRFDHDFLGRQALERRDRTSGRVKVTLVWHPEDVAYLVRSLCQPGTPAKYLELPKARYGFFHVDTILHGGGAVGLSLDPGYLANEHAFVSLATVAQAASQPGTDVTVLWGEEPNSTKPTVERHAQVAIRATVAPAPYRATRRAASDRS